MTPTSEHTPSPTSDQAVWDRLLILHARVEKELAKALQRRHGMGLSEYRALEAISRSEKSEMRMQELAERTGLEQSSITRLVTRLETAGYAYKDTCSDDRRGIYAVITDEGRSRTAAARTTYAETLSSALNSLTRDPSSTSTVQALRSVG